MTAAITGNLSHGGNLDAFEPDRLAPPVDWEGMDSSLHCVHFYSDDGYLVDCLVRFIGSALRAGSPAVIVAKASRLGILYARFEREGLMPDGLVEQGRLLMCDAAQTLSRFMVDGMPDRDLFFDAVGGMLEEVSPRLHNENGKIAVFGEMVADLYENGNVGAAIALEDLWNELGRKHAFNLRCAYPMSLFSRQIDGPPLDQVCAAHARVIPTESYTSLEDGTQRLRTITFLQHRAQVLETELAERTRLLLAEQESREDAIRALRVRDEFLSVASHELKTPVAVLKGSAQLLIRRALKGELEQAALDRTLRLIDENSTRLTRLIDALLNVSALESDHLPLSTTHVDMVSMVREAVQRAEDDFGDTHEFHISGHDQVSVFGDPVRLDEITFNLLENAVKYSAQGSTVHVSITADVGNALLTIRDEGIGLTAGSAETIFEAFGRAENAVNSPVKGIGLGLYICRRIVDKHEGTIWATSPGENLGTTIFVSLPRMTTLDQPLTA